MKLVRISRLAILLACCLVGQGVYAEGNISKSQCIKDANAAHKLAIQTANDDRKLAKLICDAGSPEKAACLQSCDQARKDCLSPINAVTKACYDAADAAFAASRVACKESAGCSGDCPGNVAFQECMVPVRVALYSANKACRLADDKEGRKACKATHRACNSACKAG